MKTTRTFKSQQANKTLKIFHNTNCKTEYAIYLMGCTICKLQYVGKNEILFNIKLNSHRKDVKDPKAILADKHFQKSGHRFNKLARFTIINRLTNTKLGKEILILLKMGWGAKRPHYQFFTYNFYKCGN